MNNNSLVGVIVDAGHGGLDSGAVGNNLLEKDLTLQAATYIYNRLQELGIPAKMTRTEDEYLPKQDRINKVLSLYNNSPNTLLISNHINAGGAEGAEVVYALKNDSTLADLILDNISEAGQTKRKTYQRRLPENPNKDYYYILRETGNTEPVLIEYGFIDNTKDAEKLKNNITDYAEGVVKAIAEYTNYPYIPNGETKNEYIVKKGDTLYSIARRFNISVADLKRMNNLQTDDLSVGQTLFLEEQLPQNDLEIYIVEKNDTLYSIARKYNTTVDYLKKVNNLTSNTLSIGQQLLVPKTEPLDSNTIYIVQKGDSLWKIAQKFNIPVTELINMNNLENLTLQVNQELIVPDIVEEDTYIVKKGDTLWSVSRENNVDINTLKELNQLTDNLLSIGQVLKLK